MRKTMAIIQSILSFAVAEELVEFNAAASVRKPRYERAREPQIFLPAGSSASSRARKTFGVSTGTSWSARPVRWGSPETG
jgi:hypothetical protein